MRLKLGNLCVTDSTVQVNQRSAATALTSNSDNIIVTPTAQRTHLTKKIKYCHFISKGDDIYAYINITYLDMYIQAHIENFSGQGRSRGIRALL